MSSGNYPMDVPQTLLPKSDGMCFLDTGTEGFLSGSPGPSRSSQNKEQDMVTWLPLSVWERPLTLGETSPGTAPREPAWFCPGLATYSLVNLPGPPPPYKSEHMVST